MSNYSLKYLERQFHCLIIQDCFSKKKNCKILLKVNNYYNWNQSFKSLFGLRREFEGVKNMDLRRNNLESNIVLLRERKLKPKISEEKIVDSLGVIN